MRTRRPRSIALPKPNAGKISSMKKAILALIKSPGEHASWELSSFNTFDASARDRLAKFVEAYDVPPEMDPSSC